MSCGSKVELVKRGPLPEELVSFYTGKVGDDSDDSSISQELRQGEHTRWTFMADDMSTLVVADSGQIRIASQSSTAAALDSFSNVKLALEFSDEEITYIYAFRLSTSKRIRICIIAGYASGHVRFFSETGALLMSQLLHDHPVSKINCGYCFREGHMGHLFILYSSIIVAIDGLSLYSSLIACFNHTDRSDDSGSSEDFASSHLPPLFYRKWRFRQPVVNDVISHDYPQPSFLGVREADSHFVVVGFEPMLSLYPLLEDTRSFFSAVQLAANMAKLTTAVFSLAKNFLGLSGKQEAPADANKGEPAIEPAVAMDPKLWLSDDSRKMNSIVVARFSPYAAITDSYGRVVLVDLTDFALVRLWKGYRHAECAWLQTESESDGVRKWVDLLVISLPKRGLIEVWRAPFGERLSCLKVPPQTKMVGSICELGTPPSRSQCFFLSPAGEVYAVKAPPSLTQTSDLTVVKTLLEESKEVDRFSPALVEQLSLLTKSSRLKLMESLSNESAIVHINLAAAMAVVENDRQSWYDHRVAVLRLFQHLSRVHPSVAVSAAHQDPACPRAAARYSLSRVTLEQLLNKIPEWPDFCVVSPATFAQMFIDSSEFESKVLFSVAFCREASIEVLHPFKSSGCLVQSSDAATLLLQWLQWVPFERLLAALCGICPDFSWARLVTFTKDLVGFSDQLISILTEFSANSEKINIAFVVACLLEDLGRPPTFMDATLDAWVLFQHLDCKGLPQVLTCQTLSRGSGCDVISIIANEELRMFKDAVSIRDLEMRSFCRLNETTDPPMLAAVLHHFSPVISSDFLAIYRVERLLPEFLLCTDEGTSRAIQQNLMNIEDPIVRNLGLNIVWNSARPLFANMFKLIQKCGKAPKELLCQRTFGLSFDSIHMLLSFGLQVLHMIVRSARDGSGFVEIEKKLSKRSYVGNTLLPFIDVDLKKSGIFRESLDHNILVLLTLSSVFHCHVKKLKLSALGLKGPEILTQPATYPNTRSEDWQEFTGLLKSANSGSIAVQSLLDLITEPSCT